MSRIAFIIKKSTRPCINIKSSVIVKCYLYIGGWSGTQNPGFIYSSVYVVSIFFCRFKPIWLGDSFIETNCKFN